MQAQGWILGKDKEAFASGPSFSEIPCSPLRVLHHCLFKRLSNTLRATFKEALKQVICFSKLSKNSGKMCHRRHLSIVKLQNFTKFYSFRMCLMLLNSVHKLKCEANLTLYPRNPTSTIRNGDVFGPLSESLPVNFNIYPCANYLSICK